ncbi:MAG: RagB/SusD family nutrient uptake outer membrane protein [Bacteroidales bacterium]|nr:RagB/SusD family nutrient uptake outer membrane protein [Bacteroidales bacterium]MDD3844459.1 RagB/SusD family nutrient uptake outer membrane protein [Bacteroidales bacterium]
MKKLKTYNIIKSITIALSALLLLGSCEKFLDVRPKSEIPAGLHFERESGYADQLTGVYTKMCETDMYGKQLTFGFAEVLSQNYDLNPNNTEYYYASQYNYTESNTRKIIDNIWSNTYNCIANLNIMLEYIEKADSNMFSGNNYNIYKGEALGLRAFLHFDMLRLFAPSYAANPTAAAIPYVTEYAPKITEQSTVAQTLDLIIADLEKAVTNLKSDSLNTSASKYTHTARRRYFNYFAAEAALARVYLYKGDKANALKYAEKIIEESEVETNGAFFWTHFTSLETTYEYEVNRLYTPEHIFQLRLNKMDDIVKYYFTQSAGINALMVSDEKADAIYEKTSKGYGNDYRLSKSFLFDGASKYLSKFWQYENGPHNNTMPIIRKTEAFYIAAEVLKDTDPTRAIELLNTVRSYRKLEDFPLPLTLTPEEINQEIFKEYRKEFLGEGQLFFYYKRLNLPTIIGAGVPANQNIYVLPMPDNETEFGNRK